MSLHDWIAAQITKSSIGAASTESVSRSDPTGATRLIDAAGALRSGQGQAFGLQIPSEGIEGAEALVTLCLRAVEQWAPALEAESQAELGVMLERLGLPPIFAAPIPPERVGTLELLLAASAEEEDVELKGAALAALHDVPAADASLLADLPCIARVARDWLVETGVRLVHHEVAPHLRCELAFEVTKQPSEDEVFQLVRVIENELLDTAWSLNLEWILPDDVSCLVHLQPKVVATRFESAGVD